MALTVCASKVKLPKLYVPEPAGLIHWEVFLFHANAGLAWLPVAAAIAPVILGDQNYKMQNVKNQSLTAQIRL